MSTCNLRILDENDNEVIAPDLTVGCLISQRIVKKDATPIDNITKFAWDDVDYEDILRYVVIPETERINERIAELKKELSDTDYIVNKIIEGVCTWDDYPDIREQRQQWRDEINELEKLLN